MEYEQNNEKKRKVNSLEDPSKKKKKKKKQIPTYVKKSVCGVGLPIKKSFTKDIVMVCPGVSNIYLCV